MEQNNDHTRIWLKYNFVVPLKERQFQTKTSCSEDFVYRGGHKYTPTLWSKDYGTLGIK